MKTPFDYLCGMQCVVGDQVCPAFDVCPANKNLVRGILTRYSNCCRRDLKYGNTVDLSYDQVERLVRWNIMQGFRCPVCGITMTINEGQTGIDTSTYSIDHVKPMGHGGMNTIDNLIICCRKCNQKKSKGENTNGGDE